MKIGEALEILKTGAKVFRPSWKEKEAYLFLQPAAEDPSGEGGVVCLAYRDFDESDAEIWPIRGTDLAAEDWARVP